MTYRERWEQDHPGEEFRVGYVQCPSTHGYRPKETVNDCKPVTCTQCWNSRMPEENSFEGAITRLSEEAVKTGEALKKAITEAGQKLTRRTILSMEEAVGSTIKDSGDRTQFETGAVRDMREGKGRCDLMPLEVVGELMGDSIITRLKTFLTFKNTTYLYTILNDFAKFYDDGKTKATPDMICEQRYCTMFLEVAKHFEEGAKKYGENNWQKGIPVHCYIDSAIRHYLKWLRGDKDEPHDRAFVWNIMCCIWEVDYHKKDEEDQ